ncbi:MAG: two-component sensor histidine kinase, partial [Alphaproteobacteria bacterium]|nr:two-component sensor histidine kinase [Alphaproteobacteria bacterium]
REDLGMIASQTERVRKIVRSLLNFSRQSNLAPEKTDVNALISESVRLMKNQALIKGIDLTFDPDDAGMGHIRPRDGGERLTRQIEIVAVAAPASEQPGILDAQNRRADAAAAVGVAGRQDCLVD